MTAPAATTQTVVADTVHQADMDSLLTGYLAARGHALSTAALHGTDRFRSQAAYVLGEARELRDAVTDAAREQPTDMDGVWWQHARHELADVVLSAAVLARYLRTTVETCIAEKTEADRGRG